MSDVCEFGEDLGIGLEAFGGDGAADKHVQELGG
jgi:hypothetical protein